MKSELLWVNIFYGVDTPKYFDMFGTVPTNDVTLNAKRNRMKIKYILGKNIWASLESAFHIEILGKDNEFTIGKAEEYDRPLLWDFI